MTDKAVHVVATLVAKPERATDLHAALAAILDTVRREPGCIRYDLHRDLDDPATFVMLETWADEAALTVHGKAPALTGLAPRLADLLAKPLKVDRLEQIG